MTPTHLNALNDTTLVIGPKLLIQYRYLDNFYRIVLWNQVDAFGTVRDNLSKRQQSESRS